jgi:hypothetical protein
MESLKLEQGVGKVGAGSVEKSTVEITLTLILEKNAGMQKTIMGCAVNRKKIFQEMIIVVEDILHIVRNDGRCPIISRAGASD